MKLPIENDTNFNARVNRDELEAFKQACKLMDTNPSREFRIFMRSQLQACGMWEPQSGLIDINDK